MSSPAMWRKAIAGAVLAGGWSAASLWAQAADRLPQGPGMHLTVKVDFGADRGQNYGTLFEVVDAQGRALAGAGFPGLYNTTCRNDRRGLQFFVRPADDSEPPRLERLPKFSGDTGVYIGDINGRLYALGQREATRAQAWDAAAGRWDEAPEYAGTPLRNGDGQMHLGGGVLTFRDGRIAYDGSPVLAAPAGESIHHVYYALGHLFFFHDRPGEAQDGAFTRVCALPWTPGQPAAPDLARAVTWPTHNLHETTWAWGQVRGKVLTVTNWGTVLAFDGTAWKALREYDGKSFQVYAMLNYYDRLLLGQYPSGCLFEYDGEAVVPRENWPPAMPGVARYSREAQSMALYRGDLYAGVWPWAELWRLDRPRERWSLVGRMFTQPPATDAVGHPFEAEIVAYNAAHGTKNVMNDWGQRATSLSVVGDALYVGTSNKGGSARPADYTFIGDDMLAEYGQVLRLRLPGQLTAQVRWVDGPTGFEFAVRDGRMCLLQDGRELAAAPVDQATAAALGGATVTWGRGVFGPLDGRLLLTAVR